MSTRLRAAALLCAFLHAFPAAAGGDALEDPDRFGLLSDPRRAALELTARSLPRGEAHHGAANGYGWEGAAQSPRGRARRTGSAAVMLRPLEAAACMARLHQPWGRRQERAAGWSAGNEFIESRLESVALDGACALDLPAPGGGAFRVIGGLRAAELELFHQTGLPANVALHLRSDGRATTWLGGLGWRSASGELRVALSAAGPMRHRLSGASWFNGVKAPGTTAVIETPPSAALRIEGRPAAGWRAALDLGWTWWGGRGDLRAAGVATPLGPMALEAPGGLEDAGMARIEIARDLGRGWSVGATLRGDQHVSAAAGDRAALGALVERRIGETAALRFDLAGTWQGPGSVAGADRLRGGEYRYRSGAALGLEAGLRMTIGF